MKLYNFFQGNSKRLKVTKKENDKRKRRENSKLILETTEDTDTPTKFMQKCELRPSVAYTMFSQNKQKTGITETYRHFVILVIRSLFL